MSFLKQYRMYLGLMSLCGVAPFIGFYSITAPSVRVYVPFIAYTLFVMVLMPTTFVAKMLELFVNETISIRMLSHYAHFLTLALMCTLVLLASVGHASLHAQLLGSIETFHNAVCTLDANKRSSPVSRVHRLMAESCMCNFMWTAALFHIHLKQNIVEAIVTASVVFVIMTFMFHVRTIVLVLTHDLRIVRANLFAHHFTDSSYVIHEDPVFGLFNEFLQIKHKFEAAFGKTLALCAVCDFLIIVICVYYVIILLFIIGDDAISLIEGIVGYVSPLIFKNVMIARACVGLVKEVIACFWL